MSRKTGLLFAAALFLTTLLGPTDANAIFWNTTHYRQTGKGLEYYLERGWRVEQLSNWAERALILVQKNGIFILCQLNLPHGLMEGNTTESNCWELNRRPARTTQD